MAIAFVASSQATSGALALPTGAAAGMCLIVAASTTTSGGVLPTLDSNFTLIDNMSVSTAQRATIGYRVLDGSETDAGTWTNAARMIGLLYSGTHATAPIGSSAKYSAVTATLTLPALTPSITDNTAWWVGFCAHRGTGTGAALNLPTGTTRETFASSNTLIGGDSDATFTSFAGASVATGSANQAVSITIELIADAGGLSPINGAVTSDVSVGSASTGQVVIAGAVTSGVSVASVGAGSVVIAGAVTSPVSVSVASVAAVIISGNITSPISVTSQSTGGSTLPAINGAIVSDVSIGSASVGKVVISGSVAATVDVASAAEARVLIAGSVSSPVAVTSVSLGGVLISGAITSPIGVTTAATGTVGAVEVAAPYALLGQYTKAIQPDAILATRVIFSNSITGVRLL